MTVAAIDPVIANVMFVAKRHRLIEWKINIRCVGRPINCRGQPATAANQDDKSHDRNTGVDICGAWEDLCHIRSSGVAALSRWNPLLGSAQFGHSLPTQD